MRTKKPSEYPYSQEGVLEKIEKFDIAHVQNVVKTSYDQRVLAVVDVSEKYWSFDFRTFALNIIKNINKYFSPEKYSFRINGGAQEIRLIGETVKVGGDIYYKMFNLVNSSDKTRALQMNIGLVREANNTPVIISVENENASVSGRHFYKSLPDRLAHFVDVLPEFNIIIEKQVAHLQKLNEKTVSLKSLYRELLREDEDGVIKPSDILRVRALTKRLLKSQSSDVMQITNTEINLLNHPKDLFQSSFDLNINAKKIINLYTEIYTQRDSTTIERECHRLIEILDKI
jgi:hypothetical protein